MNNPRRISFCFSCMFVLLLTLPVVAQDSVKKSDLEKPIVSLPLPKMRFHKPKLLMQDALKKAEEFIAKNKIPIDEFFLHEARIFYGNEKQPQPGWYFMWMHQGHALGNYIHIFVSMEGQVQQHPTM